MLIDKTRIKRAVVQSLVRCPLPLSLSPLTRIGAAEILTLKDFVSDPDDLVCNLNFDDLCPKYLDHDGLDYGGRPRVGVAGRLAALLERWPEVAVTLFAIPDATMRKRRWRIGARPSYDISSPDHSDWLLFYNNLRSRHNLEFALHGLHHWQTENRLFGRQTEFAFKRPSEAEDSITRALAIFRSVGWEPTGFRQPGWGLTDDLSLLRVLQRCGLRYIAGSTPDGGLNANCVRVAVDYPCVVMGIVNIPQNVNLDWTLEEMKTRCSDLASGSGLVSIKGHFVDRDDTNCLSAENLDKLLRLVEHLVVKFRNRVRFRTCGQIAEACTRLYKAHLQELDDDGHVSSSLNAERA
jgi:predicted deacetylase